jgi:hypothetical protein
MRASIALLMVAVVATTAGCGFLTGEESLNFEATEAPVSNETLSDTGYEKASERSQTISRDFTVADQTRTVNVTNHLHQYDREVDLGPVGSQRAAVFATIATPEVDVAGQTFNPIDDLSNRELLSRFESEYDGLSVGQQVDNRTHTVLGTETGVEKYEGTADLDSTSVDVYIHVTTVKHESDFVVALGIYPQELDGEEERVFTMLDGIQHEG